MAGGWIKLYRSILEDPVWTTATAEQKTVLVVTLLLASHATKQWAWGHHKFKVEPGKFVTSLPSLAKQAGVSIQNVRSAIKRLEKLDFLTCKATVKGRVISVRNWDIYQGSGIEPKRESNRQPTDTQQLSRSKECKKEKHLFGFDTFWQAYPKKQSKLQAQKAWSKIKPDLELRATILNALKSQKSSDQWQKDEGQYIPLASTWLNQRRWEDEVYARQDENKQQTLLNRRIY